MEMELEKFMLCTVIINRSVCNPYISKSYINVRNNYICL